MGTLLSGKKTRVCFPYYSYFASLVQSVTPNFPDRMDLWPLHFLKKKKNYWSIVDLQYWQSESVVHIHISTHFKILFSNRSLQSTE